MGQAKALRDSVHSAQDVQHQGYTLIKKLRSMKKQRVARKKWDIICGADPCLIVACEGFRKLFLTAFPIEEGVKHPKYYDSLIGSMNGLISDMRNSCKNGGRPDQRKVTSLLSSLTTCFNNIRYNKSCPACFHDSDECQQIWRDECWHPYNRVWR